MSVLTKNCLIFKQKMIIAYHVNKLILIIKKY